MTLAQRQKAIKQHEINMRRKAEIASHYGGKCACCGEKHIEFLQLHHKNEDGWAHRLEIAREEVRNAYVKQYERQGFPPDAIENIVERQALFWAVSLWAWVQKNDYPQNLGLELLCANCHVASRSKYIKCPHKREDQLASEWDVDEHEDVP